jgi:hypothetical protein
LDPKIFLGIFLRYLKCVFFPYFQMRGLKHREKENLRVIITDLHCSILFSYFNPQNADVYNSTPRIRQCNVFILVLLYLQCNIHSQFPNPCTMLITNGRCSRMSKNWLTSCVGLRK